MAAHERTVEVAPSGEAARLVEKWLGVRSLPALYEADALHSVSEEPSLPGLGLGARPSAQQQTKQPLSKLDQRLARRIAAKPPDSRLAPQQTVHSEEDQESDEEAAAGRAGAFLDRPPRSRVHKLGKESTDSVKEQGNHAQHHRKKFKGAAG